MKTITLSGFMIECCFRCLLLSLLFVSTPTDVTVAGTTSAVSQTTASPDYNPFGIEHVTIYQQDGRFAGWPANNGIYSWGDEILVGFVEAAHYTTDGFHTYNQETARNKYARSLDGGVTWTIEDAYDLGQKGWAFDNNLSDDEAEHPRDLATPVSDFTQDGFIFSMMRYNYHYGPSIFYYSEDRGHQWHGPFQLPDRGTPGGGSRTDYLVNGPQDLSVFLTVRKQDRREGRVAHARTTDGGVSWELVSWLGPEPEGFDIMPSTVRQSSGEWITAMRSRNVDPSRDFMKAFRSANGGQQWERLPDPVADTGHYGAPPALLQLDDGRLALAYAYRSQYGSRICLRLSDDGGESWSHEIPVRAADGANGDVGYPRMVQREDGDLVIVYYWNHALRDVDRPYRYIAASIVDPGQF